MPVPFLELRQVSKAFGGTLALQPLDLSIAPGEILGLVGENGAGKSTLIKIISGVLRPDSGTLRLEGEEVVFASPHAAAANGIATIHQELAYFERLTVTENLLLNEPDLARQPFVSWNALHAEAEKRLTAAGLNIDPRAFMQTLSSAQRQEIAIARALSSRCKLLVLDEPTASLTEPEVERLMNHLHRLHEAGVAMLYVSHRLDEILKLTDRVAILRDGRLVASYPTGEASVARMVGDMVGRKIDQQFVRDRRQEPGSAVFESKSISKQGLFHEISLQVHAGEVLGLAGLVGAGRSEIARTIVGLYELDAGSMLFNGQEWHPRHPAEAARAGLVYVPEERKRQGLVLEHSLRSNVSIGFQNALSRFGLINATREKNRVQQAVDTFAVKASSIEAPIGSLSGGNQQKCLLARWLETDPRMIILDEPTRGVDVGAKLEIYALIDQLARKGKAILLISSDLPELLTLSDRIQVIYNGRTAASFAWDKATQEKVLLAASGFHTAEA